MATRFNFDMDNIVLDDLMFDLDNVELDAQCPKCKFYVYFTLKDAKLNKTIICGGCKNIVQLVDYMSSCDTGIRSINRALKNFENTIRNWGK